MCGDIIALPRIITRIHIALSTAPLRPELNAWWRLLVVFSLGSAFLRVMYMLFSFHFQLATVCLFQNRYFVMFFANALVWLLALRQVPVATE